MTAPADREFYVFPRGYIRDLMLQYFAAGLRLLVNPETQALFTEDEIASAIAPGSRWYRQAQAEDDYAQGEQHRALFMNDQLRIDRASTAWLAEYHAKLWDPSGRLPATPGSGRVRVPGTPGVHVIGSTTPGDPSAYWGRDQNGHRYQVYEPDTVIDSNGAAIVTMVAMDPGAATNPETDDVITWANRDPGMAPQATVIADFTGGTDTETDQQWASRMLANVRWKQGDGNDPQVRAWARECSNAIEDAFVYPCALHANSVVVCITQKRGYGDRSPTARIPPQVNSGVIAQAVAYLTPPASPVFPTPPLVIVVPPSSQVANVGIKVEMAKGSSNGWLDVVPFPAYSATACPAITSVGSTSFVLRSYGDATLPGQAAGATVTSDFPGLLVWNIAESEFVDLTGYVTSIHDLETTPPTYEVTLNATLPAGVVVGAFVSPAFANHEAAAQALIAYFDERGPGDLFNPAGDDRADRCVRFPAPTDEYPPSIGGDLATRVIEALEGQTINASIPAEMLPTTSPSYPTTVMNGPRLLTLGKVGIYPL